jgi:putative transposase
MMVDLSCASLIVRIRTESTPALEHAIDLVRAVISRGWDGSIVVTRQRKAKFSELDVSDAKRLKALEDENGSMKKLLAKAMLDNAILKDLVQRCASIGLRAPFRCTTEPRGLRLKRDVAGALSFSLDT